MTLDLRFVSNLRIGLSRLIGSVADGNGLPQGDSGTFSVNIETGDTRISRSFRVLGPEAVAGLGAGEVQRVDPRANTPDHPPNLFPTVELKTADLPWRYTLAQAYGERLIPWLVLVVVREGPGVSLEISAQRTVLTVGDVGELPDLSEAWAWAHVQNAGGEDDLDKVIDSTPEALWSRLLCPRLLEPDSDYLACIIPSFETGRLAGLGLSAEAATAGQLAWNAASDVVTLPVYYHWRFHTAPGSADFEELVRRLQPIMLSPDVGMHPLDLSEPGSKHLPQADVQVGYLGALVSAEVHNPPWRERHRGSFETAMHDLLAQAASGRSVEPDETYDPLVHDPVVAPPRYGLFPSGLDDIPPPRSEPAETAPKWLEECNLDPRHRAVAGVGAEVVRRNQERLMADAWAQADGITHVNRLLNQTRLALEVGRRQHVRVEPLAEASVLQLTRGAHARLRAGAAGTVFGALEKSDLPGGTISAAFRRQMRAGGLFAKALRARSSSDAGIDVARRMTDRITTETATVLRYADLTVPYGTLTTEDEETASGSVVVGGIQLRPVTVAQPDLGGLTRLGLRDVLTTLRRRRSPASTRMQRRLSGMARTLSATRTADVAPRELLLIDDPAGFAKASQAKAVAHQDFATRPMDSVFAPLPHTLSQAGTLSDRLTSIDVAALSNSIHVQLEPTDLLAARLRHVIQPAAALGAEPVPASLGVSPLIGDPLYADVVRMDAELLMPGVGALPSDSIGAAVVNSSYIEAFLLGANDEFARELLWREYPTDLGGTWLRTFWDRRGTVGAEQGDIPAVAEWTIFELGAHPSPGVAPNRTVVLIIKGELLRRYPNTLISAVPARWREDGGFHRREEDADAPALSPAFAGHLLSDVVFVGFQFDDSVDIDADVIGSPHPNETRPGWYFAFEQPPTEPAFGLDTAESDDGKTLAYWKDLTWTDARLDDGVPYVQLAALDLTLPYDRVGANQWTETWGDSAAAMARITLQRPVRMLVHADQMLEAGNP